MAAAGIGDTPMHVGANRIVYNPNLLTLVGTTETVIRDGDTGVKSAAVEPSTVETAAVETASVPSASASVGEIWLTEDSRAQQRSCNTHHSPCLPRSGFVVP